MEQALVDWDAKSEADQTWKKVKAYFTKEYANQNKYATIESKQASFVNLSANHIREEEQQIEYQALAAKTLAQIQVSQTSSIQKMMEQQHAMLESNQKLMIQMMQTMLANENTPANNTNCGFGQGNGGSGGVGGK